MRYEAEKLTAENAIVGEGPVWVPERQVLYWTDIQGGKFWEYDPAKGTNTQLHDGDFVAGVAVNAPGGLTVGTWEGVKLWRSDEDWSWLYHGDVDGQPIKLNDVIAGPDGSFIGGSGHLDACSLFRFKPDGTAQVIDTGRGLCNGMGFSPDLTTFYSTDSVPGEIYAWDRDAATGDISNRRVFASVDSSVGIPDGMTVDAEGFVWSAIWYGGMVVRFDPDGREERRVEVPAAQTSSAMFGGKDMDELYVTTASFGSDGTLSGMEPPGFELSTYRGGDLYRVKVGIQGKPEFKTQFALY